MPRVIFLLNKHEQAIKTAKLCIVYDANSNKKQIEFQTNQFLHIHTDISDHNSR